MDVNPTVPVAGSRREVCEGHPAEGGEGNEGRARARKKGP